MLAHNVHATDAEIERFAARGAAVAHCPCSNAALGSGIFPMRRHRGARARFALGTDVGGGIGFGVMKEALQAHLMQRIGPDPMTISPAQMLYLATRAGAEALGMEGEIGDFSTGKSADYVVMRPAGVRCGGLRARRPAMLAALFTPGNADSIVRGTGGRAMLFTKLNEMPRRAVRGGCGSRVRRFALGGGAGVGGAAVCRTGELCERMNGWCSGPRAKSNWHCCGRIRIWARGRGSARVRRVSRQARGWTG